jgi:hypothetical protein
MLKEHHAGHFSSLLQLLLSFRPSHQVVCIESRTYLGIEACIASGNRSESFKHIREHQGIFHTLSSAGGLKRERSMDTIAHEDHPVAKVRRGV